MIESLAEAVGKEKMRAIGISNIVNSMSKERENEQIQLQVCLLLMNLYPLNITCYTT